MKIKTLMLIVMAIFSICIFNFQAAIEETICQAYCYKTSETKIQSSGHLSFSGTSTECYRYSHEGGPIFDKDWVRSKIVVKNVKRVNCSTKLTKKWLYPDKHNATAEIGYKITPRNTKKSCSVELDFEIWIKKR